MGTPGRRRPVPEHPHGPGSRSDAGHRLHEGHCWGRDCRAAPHSLLASDSPVLDKPLCPEPTPGFLRPRRRGAGLLGGMGRHSPRKSSVITWPQTDVILKRAGCPANAPLYSCTEQVPFSPLREDMLPAEGHRQARPDAASPRPGRPTVLGDRSRAVLHTSVFTLEFESCLFQTLPRNAPDTS